MSDVNTEVHSILAALEPLRTRGFWLAEQSDEHVKLVRLRGADADALLIEWDPRPHGRATAVRVAHDEATADPMSVERPRWQRRGTITDVVGAVLALG